MEKNQSVLGGFEAVTQQITGAFGSPAPGEDGEFEHDKLVDLDDDKDSDGDLDNKDNDDKDLDNDDKEKDLENDDDVDDDNDDDKDLNDDVNDDDKNTKDPDNDSNDDAVFDLGEAEPEIAQLVHEKLTESLGWEMDEDTKLESVEEVVEYMKSIVEENSVPEYANDELKQLDEFVRDGGDIKNYLENVYGGIDYDNIDIDNESNQKRVIKENLKSKGYSDNRIKRMIDRYEDAGTLAEEAEDALDLLKEYKEEMSQKLLEDQKKQKQTIQKQQQKYMSDVEQTVGSISDIRGIPISEQEKKKLVSYIFKPTSDGMTQYQKDYIKNNKNLIESAYFTMKGDTLVDKVKRKATSDAARNLKKKLAEKGKRTKDQSQGQKNSSVSAIWGLASSQLRKPN